MPRYGRCVQGYRAYRRFLPHYERDNRIYFVTFCTRDREALSADARDIVLREIVAQHRQSLELLTAVVMPEHVHLIFVALDDHALADIMRVVKGRSARFINSILGRHGSLWQREYFDRQLRDDEDWRKKCEYIEMNRVRRGILATPDEYRWLWRQCVDDTG